ncbi:DUF4062 domain-containing protein [Bacillus sp. PS93]|uniref:DUF4062 domain-containing protein n=2 Tax=Bacillus TaxID=1386 RepID=UPI0030CA75BC
MKKKLQVFISSTYTDLIEERQAAVEAVLNSGHIPAGMELFKAGDRSQKETIKRWIDESDVYMLILGGRYGSMDEETNKSYTHWEYDYADTAGKPRFAIVIDDGTLEQKVRENGIDVLERENYQAYKDFRKTVLSKLSKFYKDTKDIKLAIYESIKEYEKDDTLIGWISGEEFNNLATLQKEQAKLLIENKRINEELLKLKEQANAEEKVGRFTYHELKNYLAITLLDIPDYALEDRESRVISLLSALKKFRNTLSLGIVNNGTLKNNKKFLYYRLAPKLLSFGLVEKVGSGGSFQRIQLSKAGNEFLAKMELEKFRESVS